MRLASVLAWSRQQTRLVWFNQQGSRLGICNTHMLLGLGAALLCSRLALVLLSSNVFTKLSAILRHTFVC